MSDHPNMPFFEAGIQTITPEMRIAIQIAAKQIPQEKKMAFWIGVLSIIYTIAYTDLDSSKALEELKLRSLTITINEGN